MLENKTNQVNDHLKVKQYSIREANRGSLMNVSSAGEMRERGGGSCRIAPWDSKTLDRNNKTLVTIH